MPGARVDIWVTDFEVRSIEPKHSGYVTFHTDNGDSICMCERTLQRGLACLESVRKALKKKYRIGAKG